MNTRILLIEDEHSVASVIKKALMEDQYDVSVAMDAASAWDHISRFSYELFILDVMLPGRSGFEIAREVRARKDRNLINELDAQKRSVGKYRAGYGWKRILLLLNFDLVVRALCLQCILQLLQHVEFRSRGAAVEG